MRRRSFLAAALAGTAGLAGCSGLTGDGTDRDPYGVPETETATETPPPTTTDGPRDDDPLDRVVDLDTGPRTYALPWFAGVDRLGIDFEVGFTRTATADHPATLTTVLENRRDVPAVLSVTTVPTLREPRAIRFDDPPGSTGRRARYGVGGDRDPPSLVLVPTEDDDLANGTMEVERGETYWRATRDPLPWYSDRIRLDPGERVAAEQYVVGWRGSEGRETGTYRFDRGGTGPYITVWNTDRPGPDGESRFAGATPGYPGEGTVAWYHRTPVTVGTYLRPYVERTDLPAKVPFRFHNHTTEPVSCGGWRLYKRHGGEWFHVRSRRNWNYLDTACRMVPPGSSVDWTLHAYHREGLACDDENARMAQYLGGGRYAVTVGFAENTDASGALFEVEADPVTVRPTDDVRVEREGSTAVVTSPAFEAAGSESAVVTAERARGDVVDVERLIPEQVMQPSRVGLRNALGAFEEGIDRVRLRTARYRVPEVSGVVLGESVYALRTVDGQ